MRRTYWGFVSDWQIPTVLIYDQVIVRTVPEVCTRRSCCPRADTTCCAVVVSPHKVTHLALEGQRIFHTKYR